MIEDKLNEIKEHFTSQATPCIRDGREGFCRSAGGELSDFSSYYGIEEIVFLDSEGQQTRYDLSEQPKFWGGGSRTLSIEEGKVVKSDFGQEHEENAAKYLLRNLLGVFQSRNDAKSRN